MISQQNSPAALDWEMAAQDAAFDGICFALLPEGRLINADRLSGSVHRGPFDKYLTLPDSFSISAERKRRAKNEAHARLAPADMVANLTENVSFEAANGAVAPNGFRVAA